MNDELSREDFLDKKRDYSPFLVHLTRDGLDVCGEPAVPARFVLDWILDERILKAYDHFCLFDSKIQSSDDTTKNRFKVTCFTETPLDQIEVLVERVQGRTKIFEPFGLVFKKDFIRQNGGNPVFYASGTLFETLWQLYDTAVSNNFSKGENNFLALVNRCDESFDFHWEREWRIVGDLKFQLDSIYCGLCPEEDISYFENKYQPLIFISPFWRINKILNKLMRK
jgi:hypothetical protein